MFLGLLRDLIWHPEMRLHLEQILCIGDNCKKKIARSRDAHCITCASLHIVTEEVEEVTQVRLRQPLLLPFFKDLLFLLPF